MAIHSSVLAWRIPRTEETGGYQKKQTRLSNYTTEAAKITLCGYSDGKVGPQMKGLLKKHFIGV